MIKILMLILLGFVGYSMIQGMINPKPKKEKRGWMPRDWMPRDRNRHTEGEQMVEDPQCGTFIPVGDAVTANIGGQQRYFCSKKCLKEYKKANK